MRAVSTAKNVTEVKAGPGYLIACPKCGKIHQKSVATDSIIVCSRCGYEYYFYLKNGVAIVMSASKLERKTFRGQLQRFAIYLNQLGRPEESSPFLAEDFASGSVNH